MPEEDEGQTDPFAADASAGSIRLPAFAEGGRVDETGLALVHEGEWILPASGSEAVITPGPTGEVGGQVINYYFPIEIEVVGSLSQAEIERVARYVFDQLEAELASRV